VIDPMFDGRGLRRRVDLGDLRSARREIKYVQRTNERNVEELGNIDLFVWVTPSMRKSDYI
jgi:hypothetical protein